jgi:hypothetical protein
MPQRRLARMTRPKITAIELPNLELPAANTIKVRAVPTISRVSVVYML